MCAVRELSAFDAAQRARQVVVSAHLLPRSAHFPGSPQIEVQRAADAAASVEAAGQSELAEVVTGNLMETIDAVLADGVTHVPFGPDVAWPEAQIDGFDLRPAIQRR